MNNKRKVVIAITGASGSIYANRLINKISQSLSPNDEIVIVFSSSGEKVWQYELKRDLVSSQGNIKVAKEENLFAAPASGSARYDSMIVCPCSMGTLGRIAQGISDTLITRGADVMLKERRRLVLAIRESPYNLVHLRNMTRATEAGAIIAPLSPHFFSFPQTREEIVDTIVDRLLYLIGVEVPTFEWGSSK